MGLISIFRWSGTEKTMELSEYDRKHVRVKDIYGNEFAGVCSFYSSDYCFHEYGEDEEGINIDGYLIYASQVASIEKIVVHGTAELWTEHLVLRRYRPEDADALYQYLGKDPEMFQYSGWNPYETPEMTRETVKRFITSYSDDHFYGWVIDSEDVLIGTIGAYDLEEDHIEVGFSIVKACWGRGYATEALKRVLEYLTGNEGIPCVTAWCAVENIGSRRVLEKAGMQLVRIERDGIAAGDRTYDKLVFEYRAN